MTAALDPEDEKLVWEIAEEMRADDQAADLYRALAYNALCVLRKRAQGEQRLSTAPAEQVQGQGEK